MISKKVQEAYDSYMKGKSECSEFMSFWERQIEEGDHAVISTVFQEIMAEEILFDIDTVGVKKIIADYLDSKISFWVLKSTFSFLQTSISFYPDHRLREENESGVASIVDQLSTADGLSIEEAEVILKT